MFRELLAARGAALGANHPDTLRSRGSLANALRAAGHYTEATELRRRNVRERAAEPGAEHCATPARRHNPARALQDG